MDASKRACLEPLGQPLSRSRNPPSTTTTTMSNQLQHLFNTFDPVKGGKGGVWYDGTFWYPDQGAPNGWSSVKGALDFFIESPYKGKGKHFFGSEKGKHNKGGPPISAAGATPPAVQGKGANPDYGSFSPHFPNQPILNTVLPRMPGPVPPGVRPPPPPGSAQEVITPRSSADSIFSNMTPEDLQNLATAVNEYNKRAKGGTGTGSDQGSDRETKKMKQYPVEGQGSYDRVLDKLKRTKVTSVSQGRSLKVKNFDPENYLGKGFIGVEAQQNKLNQMAYEELRSINAIMSMHIVYISAGFQEESWTDEMLNHYIKRNFSSFQRVNAEMSKIYEASRAPWSMSNSRHLDRTEVNVYAAICTEAAQVPLITRRDHEILQKRKRTMKGATLFADQVGLPFTDKLFYTNCLELMAEEGSSFRTMVELLREGISTAEALLPYEEKYSSEETLFDSGDDAEVPAQLYVKKPKPVPLPVDIDALVLKLKGLAAPDNNPAPLPPSPQALPAVPAGPITLPPNPNVIDKDGRDQLEVTWEESFNDQIHETIELIRFVESNLAREVRNEPLLVHTEVAEFADDFAGSVSLEAKDVRADALNLCFRVGGPIGKDFNPDTRYDPRENMKNLRSSAFSDKTKTWEFSNCVGHDDTGTAMFSQLVGRICEIDGVGCTRMNPGEFMDQIRNIGNLYKPPWRYLGDENEPNNLPGTGNNNPTAPRRRNTIGDTILNFPNGMQAIKFSATDNFGDFNWNDVLKEMKSKSHAASTCNYLYAKRDEMGNPVLDKQPIPWRKDHPGTDGCDAVTLFRVDEKMSIIGELMRGSVTNSGIPFRPPQNYHQKMEGLAADASFHRSVMCYTDMTTAVENYISRYSDRLQGPCISVFASAMIEGKGGKKKSIPQSVRMSTRREATVLLGIIFIDGVVQLKNVPSNWSAFVPPLPESLSFSLGWSMRHPDKAEAFRTACSTIRTHDQDPGKDDTLNLTQLCISSDKNVTYDLSASDEAIEWFDFKPNAEFKNRKPEKLILEGLLWHYLDVDVAKMYELKIAQLFPGADSISAVWRMAFFSSIFSIEQYTSASGWATDEIVSVYLDNETNPTFSGKKHYEANMKYVLLGGRSISLKSAFGHFVPTGRVSVQNPTSDQILELLPVAKEQPYPHLSMFPKIPGQVGPTGGTVSPVTPVPTP